MKLLLTRAGKLNTTGVVLLLTLLSLLLSWQVRNYVESRAYEGIQRLGEDRLLSYISGIRQTLNHSSHLPYVLSQNQDVRELLSGRIELLTRVNQFLEQTSQVASAARWLVLDNSGRVAASSHWRDDSDEPGRYYGDRPFFYKAREGELGYYVQLADESRIPGYYLSAPIYANLELVGVAVVMIDLRGLQELWIAAQDRLLVSDEQGLIFLSSLAEWRNRRLPADALLHQPSDSSDIEGGEVLPYRWRHQQLLDGTEARLLLGDDLSGYLVQSVLLDDLKWRVHFLTDLAAVKQQMRAVTLFCAGASLAVVLLVLLLRERMLRNRSRRETEALILRNEAQQRAIISNTQVGLLTLDGHGRIQFINPRALQQFGCDEAAVLGVSVVELIDLERSPDELQALADQLNSGQPVRPVNVLEGYARRRRGECFPMLLSINPIAWGAMDGYLVTLVDITLRKQAEQALQQANEELEQRVLERTRELREAQAELIQSSKLAALGTMSAAIAHELNQPLTAIRTTASSSRLLLQRQQLEAVEKNLLRMAEMTERMALITSQLKTFAHKRPDKPGAVDFSEAVERTLQMFSERIAEQGVHVERQLARGLKVCGDQPRIEQVTINLIRNALDAMSDSTKPELTLRLESESEGAMLTIADNGCGLNDQALEHLFDPFFTTKDVGQGLGLGLSISYSIVRDLEGSIRAENLADGGACFRVRLPLYRPAETDSEQPLAELSDSSMTADKREH